MVGIGVSGQVAYFKGENNAAVRMGFIRRDERSRQVIGSVGIRFAAADAARGNCVNNNAINNNIGIAFFFMITYLPTYLFNLSFKA